MKLHIKTIREKVFFSHIIVVATSLFLTFIIFNLCINLYIKSSTKKQLINTAKLIETSINDYSNEFKNSSKLETSNNDINNYLLKINRLLREDKSFFHMDYALVTSDKKLIYPQKSDIENYDFVKTNLISIINEKNLIKQKNINPSKFYFDALSERYSAIIYQLSLLTDSNDGYVIVYADLIRTEGFIDLVNMTLLIILNITSVVSIFISNNIARKISNPILKLSEYAKKIGERQYNVEFTEYSSYDEIKRLSSTMKIMSRRLFNYDKQMKIFIQNASHELRTPLMSIQGYAEGIKYGVVDDTDKAVDIIIEESKRLSSLVGDLLYLSKIEATDEKFDIDSLNLEQIILSSIEKVNGLAIKRGKKINFICTNKDLIIDGDEEKLIRALINILGNCLRYCVKNIDVTLKKENLKKIIIIEDDGPGFDEKTLENIFDRFFKGENGNYGLGLSITKSIIEKHGGTISTDNKASGGARFTITL